MAVSVGSEPARAKAMSVSSEARPTRAKATPVSRERFVMPAGYGGAWPRCRWAAAGPGRASRSTTPSRRLACGDLAGGPPPTGTHSGRAPLCGGCRRDRRAWLRWPWAAAGPGRASRRRAERSSLRGRLAGGPPPTGAQSSPARRVRPDGTRNTSGATSNARAPARHSKRGRHQPTPCANVLTHP